MEPNTHSSSCRWRYRTETESGLLGSSSGEQEHRSFINSNNVFVHVQTFRVLSLIFFIFIRYQTYFWETSKADWFFLINYFAQCFSWLKLKVQKVSRCLVLLTQFTEIRSSVQSSRPLWTGDTFSTQWVFDRIIRTMWIKTLETVFESWLISDIFLLNVFIAFSQKDKQTFTAG